jgi:hypothetical protein
MVLNKRENDGGEGWARRLHRREPPSLQRVTACTWKRGKRALEVSACARRTMTGQSQSYQSIPPRNFLHVKKTKLCQHMREDQDWSLIPSRAKFSVCNCKNL